MELLDGNDLGAELAKRGALPTGEAVTHVLEACLAMAEAHGVGIIHRDLKPSNLFLASEAEGGRVCKVLDFGISKVTAESESALTSTEATIGTPYPLTHVIARARAMRTVRSYVVLCSVLAIVALHPRAARAQTVADAAPSDERADELKRQADTAMSGLRYVDAVTLYSEAYARSRNPAVLFNRGERSRPSGDSPRLSTSSSASRARRRLRCASACRGSTSCSPRSARASAR